MDHLATTLSSLRRPIIADEFAFYYCPVQKWQDMLTEARNAKDSRESKVALNNLRKFDHPGRIMETSEGVDAVNPCKWCTRPDNGAQCRVFKDREDLSCAWCKRYGKAGCTAKQTPSTEADELVRRGDLVELEERVAKSVLRNVNRSLKRRRIDSDTESDEQGIVVQHTRTLKTFYYDEDKERFSTKSTMKSVGINDVLIKTTHSGLCYTDVHAKHKGCGLGHEGVGIVQEIGQAVTHMQISDRVGWGWLHSSCGHCTTCITGYRQYCSEARGFAFSDEDQGAFSDFRIIDSAFAYRVPDTVSSLSAGPFMCAGASTFEALDAAGVVAADRVGVLGIGGLGHMAILFAKAMGCAVTAISSDEEKFADAVSMGADECRSTGELEQIWKPEEGGIVASDDPNPVSINVLLITSNQVPDLEQLLPLLARRATIVLMTIQQEALSIPYMPFILPGHKLIASTEASRENHIKMLDFAGRLEIKPWVEEFPMTTEGVTEAFERLETGKMRYRGVLVREDA
ncbi:hypothetical protein LTR17_007415 [Elasticomyces elasticus]|nr:hypothetical protein LTR17_007415 [Elasticomyces elasticus]